MLRGAARYSSLVLASLLVFGVSCRRSASNPDDSRRATAELAARIAMSNWVDASNLRDAGRFVSFYAPDALLLPPTSLAISGQAQIRDYWSEWIARPGFALYFRPSRIEAESAGEIVYEFGDYQLELPDANGKTAITRGQRVVVWRRARGERNLRVVVDAFSAGR